MKRYLLLGSLVLAIFAGDAAAEEAKLNIYNWSDYITNEVLEEFQKETGIKVVYDVYDSNEVLEAKLLAGHSGYDLVFPTARPFAERHIAAGIYRKLDKSALSNYDNLDPVILGNLADIDPGNEYAVPYMWGTTSIGYNVDKVAERLGTDAKLDSWSLIFDPANAEKLADCGISLLDDSTEVISAALMYLGKDPNSTDKADLDAATEMLKKIRPYIRYIHSSQYINDLANGDLCVAHGYSGDVLQARDRADEAKNGVKVALTIPREGAILAVDVMVIPADAKHPQNAEKFINFVLRPDVVAKITNYVSFANAVPASLSLLEEEVRNDPGIFPPKEVQEKLRSPAQLGPAVQRARSRAWTRVKTGR
ncbi:polyamine ABC transporter substrate-binding protein [Thiosocius teredinicola]|uniref:polyamine ABC transporter substrate-binding protein n=1 Tax=Thiosocius teredinicola TaxID=1973002 RepID=UPI00099106EC